MMFQSKDYDCNLSASLLCALNLSALLSAFLFSTSLSLCHAICLNTVIIILVQSFSCPTSLGQSACSLCILNTCSPSFCLSDSHSRNPSPPCLHLSGTSVRAPSKPQSLSSPPASRLPRILS